MPLPGPYISNLPELERQETGRPTRILLSFGAGYIITRIFAKGGYAESSVAARISVIVITIVLILEAIITHCSPPP